MTTGGGPSGCTPISITLSNALPNSTAFLCFGLAALDAPFKGGTLVPDIGTPPGTVLILPTGPLGLVPIGCHPEADAEHPGRVRPIERFERGHVPGARPDHERRRVCVPISECGQHRPWVRPAAAGFGSFRST